MSELQNRGGPPRINGQAPRDGSPLEPITARRSSGNYTEYGFRSGKVHVRDYLRMVYKHRWPAGTLLMLVMALSLLYNMTRVPIYEARVQLLIDAGTENVVNFKEVVEQDKQLYEYYQTQM